MVDDASIVVNDLPSMDFMLNPYFYRLLNKDQRDRDDSSSKTENYNKILKYNDENPYFTEGFHNYQLHLITGLQEGEMFNEGDGTLTANVELYSHSSAKSFADIPLKSVYTEYGFYVEEDKKMEFIEVESETPNVDDVTIYGWVILDPSNNFVLLYSLYDEPVEMCGQLFLDEGGVIQINIDTLCEVET